MNHLSNSFEVKGKNLIKLQNELKELDERTSVVTVDGKNIIVCYIPDVMYYKTANGDIEEKKINTKEEILSTGSVRINLFNPKDKFTYAYSESGNQFIRSAKLNINSIMKSKYPEEFVTEMLKTKTLFFVNEKYCLLSDIVDSTLYQRIDMNGRGITEHTMERNLHIARLLKDAGKCKIVIRSEDGVAKIISIMSNRFNYIRQSTIMSIVKNIDPEKRLGVPEIYSWNINNIYTEVYLEFPEKAKEFCKTYKLKDSITPGLLVSKSDVGFGAIRISGTWRINNSIHIFDTVSRKHSGDFDPEEIIAEAGRTLFGEFTLLPEKLCELMLYNVTDPNWFATLKHEDAMDKNLDRCCSVIKSVFDEIELGRSIQRKREKIIYKELCNNIDPELNYTAYDICIMIMDIPSRVTGLNKDYTELLRKSISKAPYANYGYKTVKKISIA